MEISFLGKDSFKLKGKKVTVTVTPAGVKVEDFEITGPGEYEIAEVSVIGLSGFVFRITIDKVAIGYLPRKIAGEEKERLGAVNVVLTPDAKTYDTDLEPAYVVTTQEISGTEGQPKLTVNSEKMPETTTVLWLK